MNSRSIAACDRLADRRLPRSGRADQREDRAAALVVRDAAVLAQLAHGQVLDDPLLHVFEACVICVEHLTGVRRIERVVGALRPRHRREPVEVRPDHRRLTGGVAHRLEPAQLAVGLSLDVFRHAGLFDLRAVLLDDGALVLVQLLADRVHLLAQEVLALLLLGAGLDVVADATANLELGEALALELERQRQAVDDRRRTRAARRAGRS